MPAATHETKSTFGSEEIIATYKAFGPRTKALYDAYLHILPCTVLEVLKPGNGCVVQSGRLKIRLDEDRGPYKKGEILEVNGHDTVPACRWYLTPLGQDRIDVRYRWEPAPQSSKNQN